MKQRVITGVIMAVVLIPIFVLGNWPLMILLGLFSAAATYEIYHLSHQDEIDWVILSTNLLLSIMMYISLVSYLIGDRTLATPLVTISVSVLVYIYYYVALNQSMKDNLIASLYPSIGLAALFAFRDTSLILVGYVFLITIATDVFAYFVGINFGKHKLAPSISPKKSWEGSIGGTLIALILTIIYLLVTDLNVVLMIESNFFGMIILTILISIGGQIGDLVASKMKRNYNIKDFSQIFPGHGGVMDRFDSIIFVGVVMLVISELMSWLF